ncbi:MAG: MYXO-CTERM sorting domain-containing protein [Pseudomonadota bacterium]
MSDDSGDPTAHPGAEELWYDGTDQDCDGNDDDQDGDGYGLAEDCDDLDAALHEGCPTADDTGEGDGDGDGKDPGGCGCAAPSRPTGLGAVLLALAALGVRRRRVP